MGMGNVPEGLGDLLPIDWTDPTTVLDQIVRVLRVFDEDLNVSGVKGLVGSCQILWRNKHGRRQASRWARYEDACITAASLMATGTTFVILTDSLVMVEVDPQYRVVAIQASILVS